MGHVEEELDSGVKEEAPAVEKAPEVAPAAAEAPASGCCGGGCHEEKGSA